MPNTRDEWITDEMVRAVDHLSTGQLGKLFSWLMLTHADRHGLNQDDIDAHKAARLKAKPDKLVAERLRLEKLRDIKQVEVDEYNEDLARLNKLVGSDKMDTMPNLITRAAEELGKLVADKNIKYGNSWAKIADIFIVLYPDGIPVTAYKDALLMVRICDKLQRIANGVDSTEDPYTDIAGYGLLGSLDKKEWA